MKIIVHFREKDMDGLDRHEFSDCKSYQVKNNFLVIKDKNDHLQSYNIRIIHNVEVTKD